MLIKLLNSNSVIFALPINIRRAVMCNIGINTFPSRPCFVHDFGFGINGKFTVHQCSQLFFKFFCHSPQKYITNQRNAN